MSISNTRMSKNKSKRPLALELRPQAAIKLVASIAPLTLALCAVYPAMAQTVPAMPTLSVVTVNASADASAQGLSPAYPGGQVARGGRAGILGTKDNQETPFSITSYTNELIQDRLARSVGEVLQNDPTVRVARGFGNFQESYFIRGFILNSDDVAYNGMYSLLPRQYIGTELFERVEVLRGASAFLNGANPSGGGLGGSINLLPKRAPNEPLNRVSMDVGSGANTKLTADVARRFGPDQATGVRLNASVRDGGTAVDNEKASLGILALGLDWRSRDLRLSADVGWHDNQLKRTRPNVTLVGVTAVPAAPTNTVNAAQPWSYSNERDTFGTVRAEYDFGPSLTGWAALGARRGEEANLLANLNVTNATTGAGNTSRFDNTGVETVNNAELGLRGKLRTGSVGHEWVVSASHFAKERANAYKWDFYNTQATNLYTPSYLSGQPAFIANAFKGNNLASPAVTAQTRLASLAVADTLSFMSDSLLLTLGARSQTLDYNNYAYDTGALTSNYNQSRVSPMLGVVYKASRALSVYGNYVEGLNQGETAPATAVNKGEKLSPYVSQQTEVGLKYDAGRMGGTLALFSTSKPRGLLNAANVFSSEGSDRHQGLELTVQGEATKTLRVLGGATWLSATQQNTGSSTTDGKRVIGVPSFQGNVGVEWDVTGVRGLALDARLVHTGASFANATNTLEVPGWTRLDIGARYLTEVQGRLVTLRARIDNATDQNYWASVGGYPGNGYLVVGAPRTFSLSASVDF